jgi:glycosyltransferase involved in cell wall biosynthesis
MRIAVFHDLPSGGAKRSIFETLSRLATRHTFDIYTLSTANHDFCDLRPYAANYYVFEHKPGRLFQSPFGRLNQFQRMRDLNRLDHLGQQIARKIDTEGYDMAFVHPSMWLQAPYVLKYLETPSVYYAHEAMRWAYEPEVPRPYYDSTWRKKVDRFDPLVQLYHRKVVEADRLNFQRATHLLTNSKFTAENVRQIYGREADVCYLGVDTQLFFPFAQRDKQRYVLSVGEIRPEKGYDFLIKALGHLPTSHRPPLYLIGNASRPQEVAFLTALAQEQRVEMHLETMVDFDTLIRRYNEAALVLYAPIREPLGLIALEAMACGTPVVGVNEGGVRETVIDRFTGRLADRDPPAFATVIMELLQDPDLCKQYGYQGREYVLKNWCWDRAVAQIEQALIPVAGQPQTA